MKELSLLSALFLFACGPSSASIIGTWTGSAGQGTTTMTFAADGTVTQSAVVIVAFPQHPNCTARFSTTGTYTFAGNRLTVRLNDYTPTYENCPPALQPSLTRSPESTVEVILTSTTLTLIPPATDASLPDGGAFPNIVLTRQ